jgi:hypothetical protein
MAIVDISRQAFFPSERVDLEPLQRATSGSDTVDGYALLLQRQLAERFLCDDLPRVADGFRVEIPNQTTSPGNFVMHNGVAWNRLGVLVENGQDLDAQKIANLPLASTLYYVEVELSLVAASTDARAFWNPTYDNGTDPSGDTRPPGREYSRNVSTVWQVDWSIVTNTSGFSYNFVHPNSVRIPICVLKTDSSPTPQIVATSYVTQTVLRQAAASSATQLLCVDTRHLPSSFSGTVGGTAVTVTENDRENHTLTLSGAIGVAKTIGARVIPDSGNTVFLQDRGRVYSDKPVPDPTATTAVGMWDVGAGLSADTRPRFWQASEQRGYATLQNPYGTIGSLDETSDIQIKQLKQYIDARAALDAEAAWGGSLLPTPSSPIDGAIGQNTGAAGPFATNPRYFQRAGGRQGARGYVLTVGDGVRSFGDINTNVYASTQAAIQAAIDKLSSTGLGGTLLIKRGAAPYDIGSTTITVAGFTKGIAIVGERDLTELRCTGTAPVFSLSGAGNIVHLENLRLTRSGGTASYIVEATANATTFSATRCHIEGIAATGTASLANGVVSQCTFAASAGAGIAWGGLTSSMTFVGCSFTSTLNSASAYAVKLGAVSLFNTWHNCTFTSNAASIVAVVYVDSASSCDFESCAFTETSAGGSGCVGVYAPSGSSWLRFTHCINSGSGTLYGFISAAAAIAKLVVVDCEVTFAANAAGLATAGGGSVIVRDSTFTQASSTGGKTGVAVSVIDGDHCLVDSVSCVNCDDGIAFTGTTVQHITVRKAKVRNATATSGKRGVYISASSSLQHVLIDDCYIEGLDDTVLGNVAGIFVSTVGASAVDQVAVRHNHVYSLGSTSLTTTYGVRIQGGAQGVDVSGNAIRSLTSSTNTYGIIAEDDGTYRPVGVDIQRNTLIAIDGLGTVSAIAASAFADISIAHNKLRVIGSSSSSANVRGIFVGYNASALSGAGDHDNAVIAHNTISVLTSASSSSANYAAAILAFVGLAGGSIAHNIITDVHRTGSAIRYGVYVHGNHVASTYCKDVSIAHNLMRVTSTVTYNYDYGVLVTGMLASDGDDRWDISHNTVQVCALGGVWFSNSETISNITIASNRVISTTANAVGILVFKGEALAVTGNVVSMGDPTNDAINLDTCGDIVVSGNRLFVDKPDGSHAVVRVINGSPIGLIAGNFIRTTSATSNARAVEAPSTVTTFANRFYTNGATGFLTGGTASKVSTTSESGAFGNDGHYVNRW